MTYSVSIPNLDRLQAEFKRAPQITTTEVKRAVDAATMLLQGSAKQKAPIDTGRLRQGIVRRNASVRGNVVEGTVSASAKYSLAQEVGTGIYGPAKRPIRPKSKPYLMFKINGQWVRTKEVKGVRGRFYMKGAVDDNGDRIVQLFEAAEDRITRQLAA